MRPTVTITSNVATLKAGETATITFTFSEVPVFKNDADFCSVTGGTLGQFTKDTSGKVFTSTFTPNANTNTGTASITVAAGAYTDQAGNAGGAGTSPSLTYDTLPPTVTITSNVTTLKAGETATITFTFSEDPGTSFTRSDITCSTGSLSLLSNKGAWTTGSTILYFYTATYTPAVNINNGSTTITVASAKFNDPARNNNNASSFLTLNYDTLPPTVTITSNVATLKAGETATITLTFSEVPVFKNDADFCSVTGGTLGQFTKDTSGKVFTSTFTPNANTNTGTASITVAAGAYTDQAGNAGGAGTSPSLTYDTLPPTVTITSNVATLKAGETATITFTFSEVTVFKNDADFFSVTGGTLGQFTKDTSGKVFTSTFTPNANTNTGTASITVAAGAYTDQAGNAGGAGTSPSLTYDTLPPTVTITSNVATLKAGETATITFTFSEDPGTSFTLSDITCSTGSLSPLSTKVSNADGTFSYTATYTPAVNTNNGSTTISVASAKFNDPAGNNNNGSSSLNLTYDTLQPTVTITSNVTTLKAGETATITFTFSEDPGTSFTLSDITCSTGSLSPLSTKVSNADGTFSYTATYTPAVNTNNGSTTISVASAKFNDPAGNNNNGSSSLNLTYDTLQPTVTITSNVTTLKAGETATITFTFSEDPGTSFTLSDITCSTGSLSTLKH